VGHYQLKMKPIALPAANARNDSSAITGNGGDSA
jgi:hypothetical protein